MSKKILVVEDNAIEREMLKAILETKYDVIEAENGSEALAVLRKRSFSVSAVILDLYMPVMDGFEVLEQLTKNTLWRQIPVIVTTAASDVETETRAYSLGAINLVMKPYNPDIILSCVKNVIQLHENSSFNNQVRKDKLTNIYNREYFFNEAARMIAGKDAGYYTLSCLDIENFKIINNQYGTKVGDEILKHLAKVLKECASKVDGICCRHTADKFALLFPTELNKSDIIINTYKAACNTECLDQELKIRIGRYIVTDVSLPVSTMFDRASLAEASVKGMADKYFAVYEDSMYSAILQEQEVVSEMHKALSEGQFEPWFQPQYNHSTGAIIGAEALVRWRHPQKGLIPPYKFIPVFERNGFIYELDKYVWESVCKYIRGQIDDGKKPLPVSVNISRFDIFHDDFMSVIKGLMKKYDLSPNLLRLEVTESAFAENIKVIISAVNELIEYGFTVEIDDFGSGYSSLNSLKDVPAQILKLDMKFFENSDDTKRSGSIIEAIVRMAKWLNMEIIAEGVEDKERADYLKSIGCYYIQGYYYSKPLPLSEYQTLINDSKNEADLKHYESVETYDNDAFWDPKSLETLIFNSYVGGACIAEYHKGKIEITRFNKQFTRGFYNSFPMDVNIVDVHLDEYIDEENLRIITDAIKSASINNLEQKFEFSMIDMTGRKLFLGVTLRVIAHTESRYLIYCVFNNNTEVREAEQARSSYSKQLFAIMNNISGGVTASAIENGMPRILFANEQFYKISGYTKDDFIMHSFVPWDNVVAEDKKKILTAVKKAKKNRKKYEILYRINHTDGTVHWMQSNVSIIDLPEIGDGVELAVTLDVTGQIKSHDREKEVERQLAVTSSQLKVIMENINCGVSASQFKKDGSVSYSFINEYMFTMFGLTREEAERDNIDIKSFILPEDFEKIRKIISVDVLEKRGTATVEFNARKKDGSLMYCSCNVSLCSIDNVGDDVFISVVTDITKYHLLESSEG